MKKILFILVLFIFFLQLFEAKATRFNGVYEIENVIFDLLRPAPNRPLYKNRKQRRKLAKEIQTASIEYKVPALLLTVKLFNESSFYHDIVSRDGLGSKGIGQMHGRSTRGCDTKTRPGQIKCSAKWLRFCKEKCKTWEGALTAYGTKNAMCSANEIKAPFKVKLRLWRSIYRQIKMWFDYEYQRERIRAEIIDDIEHYAATK